MQASDDHAKQQLLRGLQRGFARSPLIHGFSPVGPGVRHSAVLMLFGALDSVLAEGTATRVAADLDVLLTRRSNGMRNHAGQIAFPGGGVETSDLDRAATALREAHEETGLDPSGVDVLGKLPDAHIPVSNFMVTPVLGWWRLPSEVAADTQESVEVFRVPVAELVDPNARGTSHMSYRGQTWQGPAFKLGPQFGGHVVWGFTAIMLATIFDGVGWSEPWDEARTFEVTR